MKEFGYDPYNSVDAWRIRWALFAKDAPPGLRGLGIRFLP